MLLFCNIVKEVEIGTFRLFVVTSESILNTTIIFLVRTFGAIVGSAFFLQFQTLKIMVGGFIAFCMIVGGSILAVKFYFPFSKKKTDLIISPSDFNIVPMSSSVTKEMTLHYNDSYHILQYPISSNISGKMGITVAERVFISFLP